MSKGKPCPSGVHTGTCPCRAGRVVKCGQGIHIILMDLWDCKASVCYQEDPELCALFRDQSAVS